jgi:hypothetical protein
MLADLRAGLNEPYLLTVIARGPQILIYVNTQLVCQAQDESTSAGQLGLMAVDWANGTDLAFRNAQVWLL